MNSTRHLAVLALALAMVLALAPRSSGQSGATFDGNGESLSGDWQFEAGVLSGTASGAEPAWYRLPNTYWDTEIALEFRTPTPANGGILVRSHRLPDTESDAFAEDGHEAAPKRMHGYQVNIDTRSTRATASILEEQGRGILVHPSEDAQATLKAQDWNQLRIRSVGAVTVVELNGTTAAALHDEAYIGGRVALQVVPLDSGEPAVVEYRNIHIEDLGRAGEWRALFNGQNLDGWKNWGSEKWFVEDGVIKGRRGPKESEGYLATEEIWQDFRVRGEFHMQGAGNYGLFYHASIRLRDDGYPLISGVQGEVEPSYPGATGWHYESYKRGWIIEPDPATPAAFALRPGEWNTIEIRSKGNRVTSWVNGFRVVDFHDQSPQLFEGSFALQLHAGEGEGIDWRELYVRE